VQALLVEVDAEFNVLREETIDVGLVQCGDVLKVRQGVYRGFTGGLQGFLQGVYRGPTGGALRRGAQGG
jgi:hypothetical protein